MSYPPQPPAQLAVRVLRSRLHFGWTNCRLVEENMSWLAGPGVQKRTAETESASDATYECGDELFHIKNARYRPEEAKRTGKLFCSGGQGRQSITRTSEEKATGAACGGSSSPDVITSAIFALLQGGGGGVGGGGGGGVAPLDASTLKLTPFGKGG